MKSNVRLLRAGQPPPAGFITVADATSRMNLFLAKLAAIYDESVARYTESCGPEVGAAAREHYDAMLASARSQIEAYRTAKLSNHDEG